MKGRLVYRALEALILCAAVCIVAFFRASYFLDARWQTPEQADLLVALGGDNSGRA